MKQYGALFTTENIIAIREDRKTQTRRIPVSFELVNEHPSDWRLYDYQPNLCYREVWFQLVVSSAARSIVKIPWAVGDELYIKEPHYLYGHWEPNSQDEDNEDTKWRFIRYENTGVWYPDSIPPIPECKPCTGRDGVGWFLRSPLFMPKWAAREWLRVTAVKVERLHSISRDDAIAEGINLNAPLNDYGTGSIECDEYAHLWDSINGKKHPWKRNEWVVAYTFRKISKPAVIPEGAEVV